MKRTLQLLVLYLIPSVLPAQQTNCLHRTIAVTVADDKDVPVAGLTAENFRGSFRGAPVKFVSAKFETHPIRMVILLDLSGSMASGSKLLTAQFIVGHALASAPNGSQVALITFAEKPEIRAGLRQDRQALSNLVRDINRIDRKSLKGATTLWDAVGMAVSLLNPAQPGDVVYAVADGGDNASYLRKSKVEKASIESGLRFFAFLVPDTELPNFAAERMPGTRELAEVAEMTGGKVLNLPTRGPFGRTFEFDLSPNGQKNISDAASLLYMRFQQFYLVEIELTSEVDKPRSWKLELIPGGQLQTKGLLLQYPRKLLPCAQAAKKQP